MPLRQVDGNRTPQKIVRFTGLYLQDYKYSAIFKITAVTSIVKFNMLLLVFTFNTKYFM